MAEPTPTSGAATAIARSEPAWLYEGPVFHRRMQPKRHEFLYRIFLFCLDVDRLGEIRSRLFRVERPGIYSFRSRDHFQAVSGGTPREQVEHFLSGMGVTESPSRILLLTNARFLGYTFNPISVWFCEGREGQPLAAIAEVGNTFGELKPYLVPYDGKRYAVRTRKNFYVSPFSDLDLDFDFRFDLPGDRLGIYVDDYRGEEKILTSSLTGTRRPLTDRALWESTVRYPFITLKVITLIHWQALKLYLKRIPFHRKEESPHLQTGRYNSKKP